MQHDDDFNPFANTPDKSEILQDNPIPLALPATHPDAQANTYSQEEYDKLFRQYDAWKKHAKSLEEGFFAIADMMYETLAFLNGIRLFQGKAPLMITDINAIIENNPILNQLTNDIRQASIDSGYGVVSELVNSQNHLRNGVLAQWADKLQDPDLRAQIAHDMPLEQDIDTTRIQDELFDALPADNHPKNAAQNADPDGQHEADSAQNATYLADEQSAAEQQAPEADREENRDDALPPATPDADDDPDGAEDRLSGL